MESKEVRSGDRRWGTTEQSAGGRYLPVTSFPASGGRGASELSARCFQDSNTITGQDSHPLQTRVPASSGRLARRSQVGGSGYVPSGPNREVMGEVGHWATVCVYERGRLLMLH